MNLPSVWLLLLWTNALCRKLTKKYSHSWLSEPKGATRLREKKSESKWMYKAENLNILTQNGKDVMHAAVITHQPRVSGSDIFCEAFRFCPGFAVTGA
jgi:hypothetical protein